MIEKEIETLALAYLRVRIELPFASDAAVLAEAKKDLPEARRPTGKFPCRILGFVDAVNNIVEENKDYRVRINNMKPEDKEALAHSVKRAISIMKVNGW